MPVSGTFVSAGDLEHDIPVLGVSFERIHVLIL